MAIELYSARLTVLHEVPSVDASLYLARLTILHADQSLTRPTAGRRAIHPRFLLRMLGEDPPSGSYGGKVTTRREVDLQLLQGIGTDQVEVLSRLDSDDAGTIPPSGSLTFDCKAALDAFGGYIVADDLALLVVRHKPGSLASSVRVQASSSAGLTNLLSAAAALTLRPGDMIVVGTFRAGNLLVAGDSRAIDIVNDDGSNAASVMVEVWGR